MSFLRIVSAVTAAIIIVLLLAPLTPPGRAGMKTAGLVVQLLPMVPAEPLAWVTASPERTAVTYPSANGRGQADLYRIPDGERKAALLLFLGVNPAGRDDERVINVATALARTGFVVLVPWSESMVSGRVSSGDVELLVAAFRYLRSLGDVDPGRVGSGGFCVGASLLTIAAADPRIRNDVRFVNAFAGYYHGRDYLAQFAAKQAFYQGETRDWDPDPLTAEVFRRLLIEGVPNPAEQEALSDHFEQDAPLTPEAVQSLSPEARAVFSLLSGTTLDEARALIERLPEDMLSKMDLLSPRRYVENVRADLWIMHDRDDNLVPIEESQRLYDAVGQRENAIFTEFSFFQHVEPGGDGGPVDLVTQSWKLLRHLYRVVRVAS